MDTVEDIANLYGTPIQHLKPLTYQEFIDKLIVKLTNILARLEEGAKRLCKLGEDGITYNILIAMEQIPQFTATHEEFSNGRVDLTISHSGYSGKISKVKFEAKLWKGLKYNLNGFDQLLGYLTRWDHGGTLTYFRGQNCDDSFSNLVSNIVEQYNGAKGRNDNRFASTYHTLDSGKKVEILHFGCHMPN